MKFITKAYTNSGGRSNNEDSYLCGNGIWILADGLGGHDCGEVASSVCCKKIMADWQAFGHSVAPDDIMTMITRANEEVIAQQESSPELSSMRTTLVFSGTDGTYVTYANVGDSRFYYFRNGEILCQSEDHSVSAAAARMGEIRYEDIRFNEDRNKLLKAIGNDRDLKLKLSENNTIPVQPGDAFLLCSDGFWEYVYETEMCADLLKSSSPKEWVEYMVKRLILRTASVNNDNYTVVCVMVI